MFKKLFGGKEVPPNNGDTGPLMKVGQGHWVKAYELELSNMEDTPSYPLTHQISIGSEIGNVVIADPSISPRHCTFILQQEVVSVLDHGSVSGTFVNGIKIPPGKYIILEDTDVIVAGELEIKIKTKNVEAVEEPIPEFPGGAVSSSFQESAAEDDVDEKLSLDAEEEEEVVEEDEAEEEKPKAKKTPARTSGPYSKDVKNKTKKKKGSFRVDSDSKYATNSIIRVLAVTCDLLLAYSIHVVFYPFDEFRNFLEFIPSFISELIDVNWKNIWDSVAEDYTFLNGLSDDIANFFSGTFHVGQILLVFILVRLVTTLFLGVSISERLLGVKAAGNGIWTRVGGVLRVIIGVFTWPFLIFDIPSLLSHRTFKEFLTFTKTFISSKFFAIVGTIIFVPLFVAMALFAPLIQGLEPPEAILINDKVEQRVKVVPSGAPEETVQKTIVSDSSSFMSLDLKYSPEDVSVIPLFKFRGSQNKTQYQNQLAFYHKELQRTVTLEVFKNFDFKQLLGIGMRGNVFLFGNYPQIYDFVYESAEVHPSIRAKNDPKAIAAFANEFIHFTKLSFDLNIHNAIEVMQSETPLLKGFIEYRTALLSLLEYKDFRDISFIRIGKVTFMKVSYNKQRPFDLIIPLIKGEGKIYKVEFDNKENLGAISTKFYKYTLEESNWAPEKKGISGESLSAMQVIDLFSNLNFKKKEIAPEKAQALYGYYFEKSAKVLADMNPQEYGQWKESVFDAYQIMEVFSQGATEVAPVEGAEDPRQKLLQNFKDLKDAVESMNKTYFGIENPSV